MFCPICSTKVSVDQKFCRSCGFGLEKTVQSVSEQHPTDLARNLEEQKNKLERLGVIAFEHPSRLVLLTNRLVFPHPILQRSCRLSTVLIRFWTNPDVSAS